MHPFHPIPGECAGTFALALALAAITGWLAGVLAAGDPPDDPDDDGGGAPAAAA